VKGWEKGRRRDTKKRKKEKEWERKRGNKERSIKIPKKIQRSLHERETEGTLLHAIVKCGRGSPQ
jgi:hypothetical protein